MISILYRNKKFLMKKVAFKYTDWSKPYTRKSFINSSVFFSHNFSFNDPFDLQLPVITENVLEEWDRIREKELSLAANEAEYKAIKELYTNSEPVISNAKKSLEQTIISANTEVENKLGVLCLSKINSSVIMWGHYANSHAGICLGYDLEKLFQFLEANVRSKMILCDINYVKEVLKLDYAKLEDDEYLFNVINTRVSTKHIDWQYEKEIRIIISNFAQQSIIIPNDILTEVIFGYKTTQDDIKEIKFFCNSLYPHIKLFTACPNRETFKMDIIEL